MWLCLPPPSSSAPCAHFAFESISLVSYLPPPNNIYLAVTSLASASNKCPRLPRLGWAHLLVEGRTKSAGSWHKTLLAAGKHWTPRPCVMVSLQTPGCSCWYRNMSGYTVLILVLFLRWCYNLFVWMDWNWYRLFIYLFLQFVCGGVVVSSTYYSLQLQFTWNANQSRSLFQMWFS